MLEALFSIRRTPKDIAVALAIVLLGIPLVVAGVGALGVYLYFVVVPPPVEIPEIKVASVARTSHIYAADGSLIAALHAEHNREPVKLSKISQNLKDAVIAVEDSRFYEHRGLDVRAVFRAIFVDVRAGEAVQGGSTITQQYVKKAFVGESPTMLRKVREALVASQLERNVSKEKILERYLNTVYFGRGAYGAEAAAQTYFAKPASELTVAESALLAGLIRSPVRLSPYDNPVEAERRRQVVLDRLEKTELIGGAELSRARIDRPKLQDKKTQEEVFRYPWFVDAVKRDLLVRYGEARVFSGGLEVFTTLDPRLQEVADRTVKAALPAASDPYATLVSVEPSTGYVRALVGGRDYEKEKFNIAIQGRRQPGSAFKPFVLVAALEDGVQPNDRYSGPSKYCELKDYRSKDGCVHNFDNAGFGSITVEKATVNSVNTVFIQLAERVGTRRLVEVARGMGISARSLQKDHENIAISLGGFTEGVTPLEMASSFGTLAARGVHHSPKFVTKIVDTSGRVVESGPSKPVKVLDEAVADNATAILEKVITSGTGKRAAIDRPAAGKTGTSQDFNNAWFVGYTPELSTSVWVGYKGALKPLYNVRGFERVVGGSIPAEMWSVFMKEALSKSSRTEFAEPQALGGLDLPFRLAPAPSFTPEPVETYSPTPYATEADPSPSPSPTPTGGLGLLPGLLGRPG